MRSRWLLTAWILIGLSGVGGWASEANPPVASFLVSPEQPTTNDAVTLDAAASYGRDAELTRYEWDFDGDGTFDRSTTQSSVRHFFAEPGSYRVTLRVFDRADGRATFFRDLEVLSSPVVARRTFETALNDNRVLAGGAVTVTVTVRVDEELSGMGLAEALPAGWRARPIDDDGALFKREGERLQWLWSEVLAPGRTLTVRYSLTVSDTAPRGTYALDGRLTSFGQHRFDLPVHSRDLLEVL